MRAPPAPQQKPVFLLRGISTRFAPDAPITGDQEDQHNQAEDGAGQQPPHPGLHLEDRGLGLLDGLGDTAEARLANHDTVDHDLDGVFELLIKLDGLVQAADLAIDAHA